MKNDNEWVALDADGTIWAYCGPGVNNVLGLVDKVGQVYWKSETKDGFRGAVSLKVAALSVLDWV